MGSPEVRLEAGRPEPTLLVLRGPAVGSLLGRVPDVPEDLRPSPGHRSAGTSGLAPVPAAPIGAPEADATVATLTRPDQGRGLPDGIRPGTIAEFGAELRAAMLERGVRVDDLAAAVGVSATNLSAWRMGATMPAHRFVVALAEVLLWDGLCDVAIRVRWTTCDVCGRGFLRDQVRIRRPIRFCSDRCAVTSRREGARGERSRALLRVTRERDLAFQTIAAHCLGCEPEGICRTAACAIQVAGLSPLPLEVDRLDVDELEFRPKPKRTPGRSKMTPTRIDAQRRSRRTSEARARAEGRRS